MKALREKKEGLKAYYSGIKQAKLKDERMIEKERYKEFVNAWKGEGLSDEELKKRFGLNKDEIKVLKSHTRKKAVLTCAILCVAVPIFTVLLCTLGHNPELTLSSNDILVERRDYGQTLFIQCYAWNKTNKDWKGSVDMMIYDNGNIIYSSFDAAWIDISIKAGERDWLAAKVPIYKILMMNPSDNTVLIVWHWGSQMVAKAIGL